MTTTLRPAGAAPTEDDPNRRSYVIHANGQQVGGLDLVGSPGSHADVWIDRVTVDPAHRRRGHGSAAVLAAEEILRGEGSHRSALRTTPDDHACARAATALGYTERSRNMTKALDGEPPTSPSGTTLRPLTDAEYPEWFAVERGIACDLWRSRGASSAEAEEWADGALHALLPDGPRTAGTAVRIAVRDGDDAGSLWVRTGSGTSGQAGGWVYSVRVAPEHRRSGVGRVLMADAERVSRAAGADTLGLHVLSDNAPALGLYRSLGYRTTQINWSKNLD